MKRGQIIISTPPAPRAPTEGRAGESADADPGIDEIESRPFEVSADEHAGRLDRCLTRVVPEFSRSYLQQLIEVGAVTAQGRVTLKSAQRVQAGWRGVIELRPTQQSQAFIPEAIALQTVYEDAHLRVIDKPAGLVVHPAAGHWTGTLLNGLLHLDPAACMLPRAGIVHRLDKDTSGLMVIARTRAAMDHLVEQIAAREVHREYLALAHGPWRGDTERRIDAAIGRDARNRLRMAVVDLDHQSGKAAMTDLWAEASMDEACLVRARLHTGRTHQIRVHMAHVGHPLIGDVLYGGRPVAGMTRQALHAVRLEFAHPQHGRSMQFTSPVADDMERARRQLF